MTNSTPPSATRAWRAIGSGLGAGAFIVFDDRVDMVAVAAGAARFLSIESCGQCIAVQAGRRGPRRAVAQGPPLGGHRHDLGAIRERMRTVTDGARCYLATQYELVLQSVLDDFGDELLAHIEGNAPPAEPILVASIADLQGSRAVLDEAHRDKQPDWSFDPRWSGKSPADRPAELVHPPTG